MADEQHSTGSFSDLFDAMQQRKQPASPPPPRGEQPYPVPPQAQKVTKAPARSREVGKEGSRERGNPPSTEQGRWSARIGDLSIKPYRKDSYLFTDEEFDAMDELKLDIRKQFEVSSTKNEIARTALQFLIRDYDKNGKSSFLVQVLKAKVGK